MLESAVPFRSDTLATWRHASQAERVFALFAGSALNPRMVGGCVRDALLGRIPHDYDMRTLAPLADVLALLERLNLPAEVDAGIGLVTTEYESVSIDIVSLPAWLAANGIDATAMSADDMWSVSMGLFDFTLNAVALGADGTGYSYYGAYEDIMAGRVRFIGDAQQYIATNPRAIVRFIRMQALYGREEPEDGFYDMLSRNAPKIAQVEPVRVQYEMNHVLSGPKPYAMLERLRSCGVLRHIFGFEIIDCELIKNLERIEAIVGVHAQPSVRLLLLLVQADLVPERALAELMERWDFSEQNQETLMALLDEFIDYEPDLDEAVRYDIMEELGAVFPSLVLLRWAMEPDVEEAAPIYQSLLTDYRQYAI